LDAALASSSSDDEGTEGGSQEVRGNHCTDSLLQTCTLPTAPPLLLWQCGACTFENKHSEFLTCELCGTLRTYTSAAIPAGVVVGEPAEELFVSEPPLFVSRAEVDAEVGLAANLQYHERVALESVLGNDFDAQQDRVWYTTVRSTSGVASAVLRFTLPRMYPVVSASVSVVRQSSSSGSSNGGLMGAARAALAAVPPHDEAVFRVLDAVREHLATLPNSHHPHSHHPHASRPFTTKPPRRPQQQHQHLPTPAGGNRRNKPAVLGQQAHPHHPQPSHTDATTLQLEPVSPFADVPTEVLLSIYRWLDWPTFLKVQ
jgi:hypothetical protein